MPSINDSINTWLYVLWSQWRRSEDWFGDQGMHMPHRSILERATTSIICVIEISERV